MNLWNILDAILVLFTGFSLTHEGHFLSPVLDSPDRKLYNRDTLYLPN